MQDRDDSRDRTLLLKILRTVLRAGLTDALGAALLLAYLALLTTLTGCAGLTGAAKSNSSNTSTGTLVASATNLGFGDVAAGSQSSQMLTLSNTGAATVTISQAKVTGAGFSLTGGMTAPLTIAAGQSRTFQIQFAPTTIGNAVGSLEVTSDASDSFLMISLDGTGTSALSITTQPSNQSVIAGQSAHFALVATGNGAITYQWKKNGVSISGATSPSYTTPATTVSDNGSLFTATVSDNTGSSMTSHAATLTVNAAKLLLTPDTTNLLFGTVILGSNSILGVTFTNAGNSSVTVSNVTISGAGFSASGMSAGQIIAPGATATLNVMFAPVAILSVTGSVTVASNATNSPATISLAGTGIAAIVHSAVLGWTASTSAVAGYNVYRGTVSGGPYARINSALVATTTDTDSTVLAGLTYFYVVTAVDSSNVESAYSNEVMAVIP